MTLPPRLASHHAVNAAYSSGLVTVNDGPVIRQSSANCFTGSASISYAAVSYFNTSGVVSLRHRSNPCSIHASEIGKQVGFQVGIGLLRYVLKLDYPQPSPDTIA